MNTYIPHRAELNTYNKDGELVYTKTNYTETKRSEETTWYKNPNANITVKEFISTDYEGNKSRNRKIITTTESDTDTTIQTADEDGKILSTEKLINTANGSYHRTINSPHIIKKEIQNRSSNMLADTIADITTCDHVEVNSANPDNADITATRNKLIRTKATDCIKNDTVIDYEYSVHMEFNAHDVDASIAEIKNGAEPNTVTTQITKTRTNRDGVQLITERIQSSVDLGTYRTITYGDWTYVRYYENARDNVITTMATFCVVNGIDGIDHDRVFDDEYRKIDYDKIKQVKHFASYQEDMVGIVPQLKGLCVIFTDNDKQTHFKVCADIVYDVHNNLSHVNIECHYYTYGTKLDNVFTEYYQVKPDNTMMGKMKRLAARIYSLSRTEKRAAEFTVRLTTADFKSLINENTPEDHILNMLG